MTNSTTYTIVYIDRHNSMSRTSIITSNYAVITASICFQLAIKQIQRILDRIFALHNAASIVTRTSELKALLSGELSNIYAVYKSEVSSLPFFNIKTRLTTEKNFRRYFTSEIRNCAGIRSTKFCQKFGKLGFFHHQILSNLKTIIVTHILKNFANISVCKVAPPRHQFLFKKLEKITPVRHKPDPGF